MKQISGNPYLKKEKGKVIVDKLPLDDIINNFNTPFLILIKNRIIENVNTFLSVFNETFHNFKGFYSYKANYLPEVCQTVHSEGFGAEIISLSELNLALRLNVSGNRIIIGGPYLPRELIVKSVKNNVREIIVYDIEKIEEIDQIAYENNKVQDLCLRIISPKYDSRLGINLTEENLAKLRLINDSLNNVNVATILSHYGTQMNSIHQFEENVSSMVRNLEILNNNGLNIKKLNLGGGFPEATVMPEHQLRRVAEAVKGKVNQIEHSIDQIYFEPGRYLVGDAGFFVSKIIKRKEGRWIYLDVGNHICPKFARCSMRFYNITRISAAHKYETSIAGIIPTDQDVLAKDYFFTKDIKSNDKVMITNVGAYSLTFSNRFPYRLPKIFFVQGEKYELIFDPHKHGDFSINSFVK